MPANPSYPFAAVLMAGGRSSRMGRDKALLDWQGGPLWCKQLKKLQELSPQRVLLSCREEQGFQADAAAMGVECLFDAPGEDRGPLPAILRSLALVQMPLLVLAVDMPQITAEFLRAGVLERAELPRGFFYRRDRFYEPLAGLYTMEMLPLLQAALEAQLLGLQAILTEAVRRDLAEACEMTEMEAPFFANTNTPEEWRQTKREADSSSASPG